MKIYPTECHFIYSRYTTTYYIITSNKIYPTLRHLLLETLIIKKEQYNEIIINNSYYSSEQLFEDIININLNEFLNFF